MEPKINKKTGLNLFADLKPDMAKLIALAQEIGKYNEMLLWHSNLLDKRNYDKNKTEQISKKLKDLQHDFFELKGKWF